VVHFCNRGLFGFTFGTDRRCLCSDGYTDSYTCELYVLFTSFAESLSAKFFLFVGNACGDSNCKSLNQLNANAVDFGRQVWKSNIEVSIHLFHSCKHVSFYHFISFSFMLTSV
jgi:hypothetical protein